MRMHLQEIAIATDVAREGMSVRAFFEECVARNVAGLPYCDERGKIVGRISIRHTLKETCIPDFLVQGAHLLGDFIEAVQIPDRLAREVLRRPVEEFLLEDVLMITPAAPIVKALAIMEKSNTAYLFLADEGRYSGVVTRMGIASLMLKSREP